MYKGTRNSYWLEAFQLFNGYASCTKPPGKCVPLQRAISFRELSRWKFCADLDPAASNMTAISYDFYCFLIIDQKKSDIMCIHTYILYILYNILYIYIYIDASFIYQPPRSFLSTHSSKASLNFSSVISTPFFQSSQLVVPVGVASKSTQKYDNSNATCVWHKNLVLSPKKKMVRNPMFVFAVCPHVWKLWHTHITGWKPLPVHFFTKCPRRPLRSTRSRTKDLLPFRRSPSPWFPGAQSWRKNQLGRRGAHIVCGSSFMWIHGKASTLYTIP